jgi:DNA-binding NarL/FixJ family response regulator
MKASFENTTDSSINLFLLSEHRVLREALTRFLRRQPGMNVSSAGTYALEGIVESGCDVLLVDRLTVTNTSSDFVSEVTRAVPQAKVIFFGMEDDFEVFLQAINAGIAGYLLQNASTAETLVAIKMAARGGAICPPHLCLELFRFVGRLPLQASVPPNRRLCTRLGLTLRQQQLITLLSQGLTNKEIASGLNLSEFTVKNHVRRIMRQLHAGSRHEAVQVAYEGA